jgi:hypothetical protein
MIMYDTVDNFCVTLLRVDNKLKHFTFLLGNLLLEKLVQMKEVFGSVTSDVAREATGKGLDRLLIEKQSAPDYKAFSQLLCNIRGSLLTLLRKREASQNLTRSEWRLLAHLANKTYSHAYHQLDAISRDLLMANLSAFAAFIALRNSEYPHLAQKDSDAYYLGNMSFSWAEKEAEKLDIPSYVETCVNGLPVYPSGGAGTFCSRNLDVALRDEPGIDLLKLNQALSPYLDALLKVALRGYWLQNKEAIITSRDRLDGWRKSEEELQMPNHIHFANISNEHFVLVPRADESSLSCAVESKKHPYVFALSNFVELIDFISLIERIGQDQKHVKMPGFELDLINFSSDQKRARYMLGTGRWKHFFEQDEFFALQKLMHDFVGSEAVKSHIHKLETIYGRI